MATYFWQSDASWKKEGDEFKSAIRMYFRQEDMPLSNTTIFHVRWDQFYHDLPAWQHRPDLYEIAELKPPFLRVLQFLQGEETAFPGNPLNEDIVDAILRSEPHGLDYIFECCGDQEALDQAVKILKPGGSLIVVGIPECERWSVGVDDTRRKETSILFVRRELDCVGPVLDMIKNGKIETRNMITHRFPFSKTKEAFDLVAAYEDGVMKAMIDF